MEKLIKIQGSKTEYEYDPLSGMNKNADKQFWFEVPDDSKIEFNEDRMTLSVKDTKDNVVVAISSVGSYNISSIDITWIPDPKTRIEHLEAELTKLRHENIFEEEFGK